jgi:hypothetical protein
MNGFDDYKELLAKLGKCKTSVGCLYIKKLTDVNTTILQQLLAASYAAMKDKYKSQS